MAVFREVIVGGSVSLMFSSVDGFSKLCLHAKRQPNEDAIYRGGCYHSRDCCSLLLLKWGILDVLRFFRAE